MALIDCQTLNCHARIDAEFAARQGGLCLDCFRGKPTWANRRRPRTGLGGVSDDASPARSALAEIWRQPTDHAA